MKKGTTARLREAYVAIKQAQFALDAELCKYVSILPSNDNDKKIIDEIYEKGLQLNKLLLTLHQSHDATYGKNIKFIKL